MIKLDKISAGYGANTILNEVSLDFRKGELTSIVGVNGCGKSTLLKAVLQMVPLSDGNILLDDNDLSKMTRNEIARKVAYLAQGKNTPDMTVEQLVLHGRFPHLSYPRKYKKVDREIASSAMEKMNISKYAHKSLATLSGGMRQNTYIAMALAQSTDYILLDEPTTYLDISHQLDLMRTLRNLADNGKGIVAVMHDLPMAFTFSDRIVLLNDSQIAFSGSPEELCNKGIIEEIFGVTIKISEDGKNYSYIY